MCACVRAHMHALWQGRGNWTSAALEDKLPATLLLEVTPRGQFSQGTTSPLPQSCFLSTAPATSRVWLGSVTLFLIDGELAMCQTLF